MTAIPPDRPDSGPRHHATTPPGHVTQGVPEPPGTRSDGRPRPRPSDPRAERLGAALSRLRAGGSGGRSGPAAGAVDLAPATAYEALTRQLVERLAEEVDNLRDRVDGLLWAVIGAIALDVVLRLMGVGVN